MSPALVVSIIPSEGNGKYHPQDLHLLSTVVAGPLAGSALTLLTFATHLHFTICVRRSTPQVLFLLRSCESEACEWQSPVKMPHGHKRLFQFSS